MNNIKNNIKYEINRNLIFLIFSNYSVYLKKILTRTLIMGGLVFSISYIIRLLDLDGLIIPSAMHSVIGLVIGFLLVFRTNTAYDRWWEGRKMIGSLSQEVSIISARLNVILEKSENENDANKILLIRKYLTEFVSTLEKFLSDSDDSENIFFHISQRDLIEKIILTLEDIENNNMNISSINSSLGKLLEYSMNLERIKTTPIPVAYQLHIKLSVLFYLLTLPFGMFHDLGIYATPMVMVIYYIMAGVELISEEIENPFAGDPNDLPTAELFNGIKATLWVKKEL